MRPTRRRPPAAISGAGVVTAALFALPAVYVAWRTVRLGGDLGATWADARGPLWRTLELATLVSLTATAVGTGLAWLMVRSRLPGKRFLAVLVPLPLALPSFVGAAAFIAAIAPGGVLHDVSSAVGIDGPRSFRGLGAAWLVLSLFTYPYVYLPVAARLHALRSSVEESALLLGASETTVFRKVVLPQTYPAMAAGALLSFLYTVSDFGAVQLLGFDTLTRVIFATRLSDRALSFTAASLVMVVAIGVAVIARRLARSSGPDLTSSDAPRPVRLGRGVYPATVAIWTVLTLALVLPISSLGLWAWRGLSEGRVGLGFLWSPTVGTVSVSIAAAIAGMMIVLPVALLTTRYRSRLGGPLSTIVLAGFAVPGLVVALSLVFWTLNTPGLIALYQTFPLLILTYVIHFGSQALGGAEVAVTAVAPSMRESADLLGASRLRRILTIELPLMRPGLQAGGGLVLLSTFKELPATLLLAPLGFSTLATTIWQSNADGFYAEVGVASLALIAVAVVLTFLLVLRREPAAAAVTTRRSIGSEV